jgi:7-cyano-7-deazaguanine synthase
LGNEEIPDGHYEDESMRSTVVPFRNGIMLSICAAIAESEKLDEIYLANHLGDHAIYPDCREEFSSAMSKAIEYGTYQKIRVMTPFVYMSKRDVALRGKSFDIDLAKTWSCYKGQKIHCGTCGTCVERKEALSGFDTTEYLR